MSTVTLENVAKTYRTDRRDVRAVSNINLHVADGEFVVLVGPSGCGKSTTLRMIAGLEEITKGTIRIGDRVVNDVAPKDRDIAMVFQNYALYPHMNVYRNMAFGLKMRRVPRAEIKRQVEETAAMLDIEHLLSRRPRDLSGGEKQRVAVGRAIVRHPRAFLFDEPLSNLDARLRMHLRAELKALHRRLRTTTLYVTHDQEEAMTLGDRVAVLDRGVMQQCDSPAAVYQRPANRFVAGFVGTPPMNFFEGGVTVDDGVVAFDMEGTRIPLRGTRREELAGLAGQPLVFGVRPEHVRIDNERPSRSCHACGAGTLGEYCHRCGAPRAGEPVPETGASIPMTVAVVEPLGDSSIVYLNRPDGRQWVARVPADTALAEQHKVSVHIDGRHVHVFAHGTEGRNLHLADQQ